MSLRPWTPLAILIFAAGLAGCGKVGQLERPGPLFGQAHDGAKPEGPADRDAQDPSRPLETVDPRDRSTDNSPSRTLRIPGVGPSATDAGPPGVLPDPYANPSR